VVRVDWEREYCSDSDIVEARLVKLCRSCKGSVLEGSYSSQKRQTLYCSLYFMRLMQMELSRRDEAVLHIQRRLTAPFTRRQCL
jgi:hypothetical protein